jgi:protein-S-isoprenylcysteine O-methyltransferase Ste14
MNSEQPSLEASGGDDVQKRGVWGFLVRHRQVLVDFYIFLNVAGWVGWTTYKTWAQGQMGYVEIAFAVQNLVIVALFLVRRPHRGLDKNLLNQAVAVLAFYSGLAFMGQPATGGPVVHAVSKAITFGAHVLALMTLVNLGRSFGVLIAVRKIETRGLYAWVRHPMYLSDILFRVGFVTSHLNWLTSVLFVASSACYIYRAILEEKFLGQQPEYREYVNRVKYRFIPFVF